MKSKFLARVIVPLLILFLLVMPFGQANASGEKFVSAFSEMKQTVNPDILYDEKAENYFDVRENGYINEVYEIKAGKVVGKVPVEEFIKLDYEDGIVDTVINSESQAFSIGYPNISYKYTENSNVETRIFGQRASIVQENRGPGSDRLSIGWSSSYSHQFNIGLSYDITESLKASAGYQYSTSGSSSGANIMEIPAGYSGYWRFDPKVRKTTGTLRIIHGLAISYEDVRGYYPVTLNGNLDGWLVSVKTPM